MRKLCRRLSRVFAPFVLLAGSVALSVSAQNTVARKRPAITSQDTVRPDFKVDSTVVLVNVAVTDARGRFVTGLQQENFQVFEEKTEQKLSYFSADDAPVSIGLVLDFSHSMAGKFSRLQEAVAEFLKTANPEDEFCLVEFRDRPELSMGFTSAPEEIQHRVALTEPSGRTALLDAVYLSLRQMKKAHNPRKALLVVSDGGDNHSRFRMRNVENLARESDVEIYAIGITDGVSVVRGQFDRTSGAALLDEISEQGGGRFYEIDNPRELPAVAEKIGLELRNQYLLGYVPSNHERDGRYRHVRVKIARSPGQPRLWAYWKRGYYAPAD